MHINTISKSCLYICYCLVVIYFNSQHWGDLGFFFSQQEQLKKNEVSRARLYPHSLDWSSLGSEVYVSSTVGGYIEMHNKYEQCKKAHNHLFKACFEPYLLCYLKDISHP